MRALLGLLVVSSVFATPLFADEDPHKTRLAVRASTLGMGVELARILPVGNLTLRAGWNGYDHYMTESYDGIAYDMEMNLSSAVALLDWHPWGNATYLTAGVVVNSNELNGTSLQAGTYTIGDTTYSADDAGVISGRATFDRVVPYAGLGWDIPLTGKIAFNFELGVVFQGPPHLTLQADGALAQNPAFQTELARETASFEKDIEDYEYYPVIALGLSHRF